MDPVTISLQILTVIFIGLVLGSFATALAYRIPRGIPWASKQRSNCTSCNATLQPRDLIPLVSWLLQNGKCRHCKAKILPRYPLTELASVLMCLAAYAAYGFTPEAFFLMALVPFLCALVVVDIDYLILPDQLVLISGILGLIRLSYLGATMGIGAVIPFLIGAVLFALFAFLLGIIMTRLLKRDALGFGDVKFFAVAGLWAGIADLPAFLMLSGVLGVVLALIWRKTTGASVFPFGPALIAGLYILLLFDSSLLP